MKNENIKKILVIRFSSLGDIILTTPLLRLLKEIYPNSSIDYLTKMQYSPVLQGNPNINKIIETDDELRFAKLKELKRLIKNTEYDLIIDAHNNLRTFYLRLFSNAEAKVFKKYSLRKFLLVNFKINIMKDLPPISVRYCQIVSPDYSGNGMPEIYSGSSAESAGNILRSLDIPPDKKLICLVPSSNHFTKTYPADHYIKLISMFDKEKFSFILIGKGKDKRNIDKIKSHTGENVYNLCDKLDVHQLAEVMKRCELVIGGDTGPLHIAEAVKSNIIMLAGSSVREFGFYPQNENSIVLENSRLKCRPCSHIGRSSCPLGHFKCMRDILPDVILSEVKNLSL